MHRKEVTGYDCFPFKGLLISLASGWHLGFQEGPHHSPSAKNGSLCLNRANTFLLNTCFPSGTLESGYVPGRRSHDQPPIKTQTPDTESLRELPQ